MATRLELLDERGDSAMFEQRDSFDADLKELRSRYQELLHAPPLADASLLPELTIIRDALCFNRTYRNFLIRQLRSERHSNAVRELGEAVEETQDLQSIWSAMFDARDEHNGVIFRRLRLKKLMELIGQKAYYAKDFPLPAPLKRFNVKETPNSWK
ncbi:hypothetical protein HY213_00235 [Candidatus Peregrinibacteria bacterium]|nr:hypothetical protein [Candidatus Peregrinibacteria bacterium]